MKIFVLILTVMLLPISVAAAEPEKKPARALPPLPTSHTTRQIEGWTVRVDDRLLNGDGAALGEKAIKLLTARLVAITAIVNDEPLAKLRTVTIQLDLTHGGLMPMQYHPSAGWLKSNGYSEKLAKCEEEVEKHRNSRSRAETICEMWRTQSATLRGLGRVA